MNLKSLSLVLLFSYAQSSFAQTAGESRMGEEKSYLLDSILVEDSKDKKEKAYESINSETVIQKSDLQKGNPQSVSDVLQKVPGVSVIGGGEMQNKKISIRGLDGYRVLQQVDGAQRLESTQEGVSTGIAVETEMLSQIDVQNGADSVSNINGAMGGTVQYRTIAPADILVGKDKNSTKLKVSGDSATDGLARSIHTAAKLNSDNAVLFGVTMRNSSKVESGSPNESGRNKETQDAEMMRNTYLGKYVRNTGTSKTDIKAEYSETQSKSAAYLPGYSESNSDFRSSTVEAVVSHEQNINSNFKYEVLSYYNNTDSVKDTFKAFRNIPSTVGKIEDRLENAGVKAAGVSILPINESLVFQSKNGIEGMGNRISEDDGTGSSYFGDSSGYDAGVFSENSLGIDDDQVVLMAGARYNNYHRQSDKLSLNAPSKNGETLSTMVGVSYAPVNWMKLSGKYSLANRAPNVREMYYGTGVPFRCHRPSKECSDTPSPYLDEETAYSKELSVLFKVPETAQPRRLKITYFDDTISDYIERAPEMFRLENGVRIPAGPADATHREYGNRNLSKVLRQGIEAQAQVEQGNWAFGAAYSMIRMDCIDCVDMYSATTLNEPLLSAPADKFGVQIGHRFPSLDLEVGAEAQYVSAQRNLSDRYLNAGYGTPSYDVYGVNMRWTPKVREVGQFEVGFGIANLLDKEYAVHNSPTGTFELGRNYSLSLATIF